MALRWVPERGDKGIDMLGKICDALGSSTQDFLTMTSNNSFFEGHRAELLKLREQASRPNAWLNSGDVRKRANILKERLQMWLEGPKLEALNTLLSC